MANNLGGIYSTGTVSVAALGTVITGVGTLWTTQAEQGDWFFANGNIGIINGTITNTQLNLEAPWTGGLLSGAAYRLLKMSWLRYEPAITQQRVREFITRIAAAGLYTFVEGAAPDPGDGVEGQWALKANTTPWKVWYYTGGVWVLQSDVAAGINPTGAWSSVTAYAKNDSVTLNGTSYIAKLANTNQTPPNATYWQVLSAQGIAGYTAGILMAYNATTTDADPGAGTFRLNNATPASATLAFIDNVQVGGGAVQGLMDLWDDSTSTVKGILRCQKVTDPLIWAEWQVTGSIVDGTGYRKVTLTSGAGSGAFTATDQFAFTFQRTGNTGSAGTNGTNGANYGGTSTTSLTIGTGSKVFTTQAGLAYLPGARVRASGATPTNYMEGVLTAYSGTSFTINVDRTGGSGTLAVWNFNVAGDVGSADFVTIRKFCYIATAGQTTFSGSDFFSRTLGYTAGFINVAVNGSLLAPMDFVATNGTSVVVAAPLSAGDVVFIDASLAYTPSDVLAISQNGADISDKVAFRSLLPNPGSLWGLTLSTAGASTSFGVALGFCTDSTNVRLMRLTGAFTKTTSAWAVGSGNGALDTGALSNTWYHVFIIMRIDTGVVDVLFSLSATAPTLPASYTLFRRIGSLKVESSQWRKFVQVGDDFIWDVPINDANGISPTGGVTVTLSVPIGLSVEADFNFVFSSTASGAFCTVHSLLITIQTAGVPTANYRVAPLTAASDVQAIVCKIYTNTSAQVRVQPGGTGTQTAYIVTYGWRDYRGRLG